MDFVSSSRVGVSFYNSYMDAACRSPTNWLQDVEENLKKEPHFGSGILFELQSQVSSHLGKKESYRVIMNGS